MHYEAADFLAALDVIEWEGDRAEELMRLYFPLCAEKLIWS